MSNYVLGYPELMKKLKAMNAIRFDGVVKKQVTQMYQRAAKTGANGGGTPYDTGELMQSRYQKKDEFGYTKEYAPHVEYGHRTRGGGGFVPGQYYLRSNVQAQAPIFKKDLEKEIAMAMNA